MIEGVRKSRLDFWDATRGRKACTVVKGARRREFNESDQVEGEMEAIGLGGSVIPGTRTTALR